MKFTDFFSNICHSFYSKEFYQNLAQKLQGKAWGYLLMLQVVCALPLSLISYVQFTTLAESFNLQDNNVSQQSIIRYTIENWPELTIEDQKFKTNIEQPFILPFPGSKEPMIIIDTTNQTKFLYGKGLLLIKQEDLYVRGFGNDKIYHFTLEDLIGKDKNIKLIINQNKIIQWGKSITSLVWIGPIFVAIYTIIVGFIWGLIKANILSYFASFVGRLKKLEINPQAIFRLAILSSYPSAIIQSLCIILLPSKLASEYTRLEFFLLNLAYFLYGLKIYFDTIKDKQNTRR